MALHNSPQSLNTFMGAGPQRRRGFTLVEIMVVSVILVLLAVLLLPAASKLIVRAQDASCAKNLRTVAMAIVQYTSENNGNFFTSVDETVIRNSLFPYFGLDPSVSIPYRRTPMWCPRLDPRNALSPNIGVTGPNYALGNDASDGVNVPPHYWPVKISGVASPSKMWVFTETARMDREGRLTYPLGALSRDYFSAEFTPGQNDNALAFPHDNRKNFAFLDGHVESQNWSDVQARMLPAWSRQFVEFNGYKTTPLE